MSFELILSCFATVVGIVGVRENLFLCCNCGGRICRGCFLACVMLMVYLWRGK